MNDAADLTRNIAFPAWVPEGARHYLFHTETGLSIRALARESGCHASTVLRQVRRYESRRDDPLIDEALRKLGKRHLRSARAFSTKRESQSMTVRFESAGEREATQDQDQQSLRILRRLCETGAVLAVAKDMEKAVVVRDGPDGQSTKTAVIECELAEALALKEWIASVKKPDPTARITRYHITTAGRDALKSLMAAAENRASRAQGFAEAPADFAGQHRSWDEKDVSDQGSTRRVRYNLAESPLTGLARRKDKDGKPFLAMDLVTAGERLREDFELAQMGPKVTQDWDRFLTGPTDGQGTGVAPIGSAGARDRVRNALSDLGPGLGDVVLRCCCFLEGLETAEQRMGWSARSGKIVLRIALQRLKRHYEEHHGKHGPMIG